MMTNLTLLTAAVTAGLILLGYVGAMAAYREHERSVWTPHRGNK